MRKMAISNVTLEALRCLLNLTDDIRITSVQQSSLDVDYDRFQIKLEGVGLPDDCLTPDEGNEIVEVSLDGLRRPLQETA